MDSPSALADLPDLVAALSAVHDPRTAAHVRRDASAYLERAKTAPRAPDWGYALAADASQPPELRHFGLGLLEWGLRYGFTLEDAEQRGDGQQQRRSKTQREEEVEVEVQAGRLRQVRGWVERLAGECVGRGEPVFVRNKIAQLWVEVAKRLWGGDEAGWSGMDAGLVALWEGRSPVVSSSTDSDGHSSGLNGDANVTSGNRLDKVQLVLAVLVGLSEEIFGRDSSTSSALSSGATADPAVTLRSSALGKACVDIIVPAATLAEQFPDRDGGAAAESPLRCGQQGWLTRIAELLEWCLGADGGLHQQSRDPKVVETVIKALGALRAIAKWVIPKAIAATRVVPTVARGLAVPVAVVQMAAVEALHTTYARHLADDEFADVVVPMYSHESINLLRDVYQWSIVDAPDVDERKYALCKKLSEFLHHLANQVDLRQTLIPASADLHSFFNLLDDVFRHPSLVVSIPALHSWTRILRSRSLRELDAVSSHIGGLLETCSRRLVRYEALPDDTTDPSVIFLLDDIDTIPERHAFLGNYRRYCGDVVDVIVRTSPVEALQHILSQADSLLRGLYDGAPAFSPATFTRNGTPGLRADAQVTVVESALKGYLKWAHSPGTDPSQAESTRNDIQDLLERWCRHSILQSRFEDPDVCRRLITLLSTFACKVLSTRPTFAASVLEYMLDVSASANAAAHAADQSNDAARFPFADASRLCATTCTNDMQRLAMVFPDHFVGAYDDLERRIGEILGSRGRGAGVADGDRQKQGYLAFLFIIVHRATSLLREVREERLRNMLRPVRDAWQDPALAKSVASFDGFCDLLGLGDIAGFFARHRFHEVRDWAGHELDDEGKAMKEAIATRFQQLPVRLTKSLLQASTDKLRDGTPEHDMSRALWAELVPAILPLLLPLIGHAQAFADPDRWSHLPAPSHRVLVRVLTDRFWQSGISTESRDAFFARVTGSRHSFEGLASTVRGTTRQIREAGYQTLYNLSTLGDDVLYGIPDLPEPLAEALFGHAHALSAHHVSVLLGMVAPLIENCPPQSRDAFLPPIIAGLYRQLDRKIGAEWEAIRIARVKEDIADGNGIAASAEDDSLGDEMKRESILRQLTFSAVSLASTLLEPKPEPGRHHKFAHAPLCSFTLATPSLFEPLLLFLRTALFAPDTRSSALAARILRHAVLPHFSGHPSPVRAFLTTDLLRSSIQTLHDPVLTDAHRDAAALIAATVHLDPPAVRAVLLSLPGLASRPDFVDRSLDRITGRPGSSHTDAAAATATNGAAHPPASERSQRTIVLDLLAAVRAVGIHELGRVEPATRNPLLLGDAAARAARRKDPVQARYTTKMVDVEEGEDGAELEGVAGMFE